MPIILRLAGRYIERRLLQSVLFVLGVALGVAVVIAIDLANTSSSRAFALSTETITGRATHQIIGGPSGLPTELYSQLRLELGLQEVAPVVEDTVRVVEMGDTPFHVLGVDPFSEPPFRSFLTNVSVENQESNAFEALNAFIAEADTALISAGAAARYGVAAGDTITLQPPGGRVAVRVVGLIQTPDETSAQALDTLILTDIATAQEIIGTPDTISRIDLILPDGYDLSQVEALLPLGAVLTTPSQQNGALGQMTAAFELNLQALSLLALVVGVFLIYNTVSFSVVQRRSMLGILRAIGATKRQIFALILGEALTLGLVGTLLGLGLGMIAGRGTVGLVAQTISDLYFAVDVQSVTVEPFTLLKGIAIGMGASFFAALIPSFDATRTPPSGSMQRSQVEARALRLLKPVTIIAVVLNVVGVLLLQIQTNSLFVSFTALFCVVVGGALLTPVVLVAAMRLLTPLTSAVFGVLGRMAPRAVSRSLSRTAVAVAALTVAVSVIVGVSVMIDSFRGTIADWLDTTLGADVYIAPPQFTATSARADVDPALAARVVAVAGVERVVTGRDVSVIAPDYPNLPPVNLNVASGEIVSGERRFAWNTGSINYMTVLADSTHPAVMVSEPFAFKRGITPENHTLTLLTDRGAQTFDVIGVYYDYTSDQGSVFMIDSLYRQFFDDPYISTMAAFLAPGADGETVIEAIRSDALAGTELTARSNRALRDSVFEVFERTFAITAALRLLAVVVAFIGILSALMSLQLEQTRQYGVLRAIGMTPRQLWNYTLIQTGLMGITAGALALPVGFALALILIYVINVRSFGWTMNLILLPEQLLLAFGVAVLAALAAGLYPAGRLARMETVRALRNE
jgi:putative ABC transport system permease protein